MNGRAGPQESVACACMSMRGAARPWRAPPTTLLHGAAGIKKAALLPIAARNASVRAMSILAALLVKESEAAAAWVGGSLESKSPDTNTVIR